MNGNRWGIVLAGGEGVRMWGVARDWRGELCPKQYAAFIGSRSMLQHTLDRTSEVVSPERIVTVIGRGHGRHLGLGRACLPGRIVEQPVSRGTAAGVFLAAAYIEALDPSATLLIVPSDHFVYPESSFIKDTERLLDVAEELGESLLLLGAPADAPQEEYGWIEPGQCVAGSNSGLCSVLRFHEKPSRVEAGRYLKQGLLWNTMVIATKAAVLWEIGREHLPRLTDRFAAMAQMLNISYSGGLRLSEVEEVLSLSGIYSNVPSSDLSTDLIQPAWNRSLVLRMSPEVEWSDWGRPERVARSLRRLGLAPCFPLNSRAGQIVDDKPLEEMWVG